jgi:hypothetical protein
LWLLFLPAHFLSLSSLRLAGLLSHHLLLLLPRLRLLSEGVLLCAGLLPHL